MKILHFSDLHLGVKTEGQSRLEEQKEILSEIVDIANAHAVDAVLVCGDVFQKSVPSADAEDLFFETIERLCDDGKRFVLVVAGNHDDPVRLGAGAHLAKKHNILIVGDQGVNFKPNNVQAGTSVIECGDGYVKLKKGEETCVIAYLPYPTRSRLKDVCEDLTYGECVEKWANVGASHFDEQSFNIFASHLYLVGGKYLSGDKEKEIVLGEAYAVDKVYLPKAHYIALGHLHKTQEIFKNCYYSGAICCSRFYDKSPNVLIVDGGSDGVKSVTPIALTKAYSLKQLEVCCFDEAMEKLVKVEDRVWIELVFKQDKPLASFEIRKIKKEFPFVLNIKLVRPEKENKFLKRFVTKKEISSKELFENFYEQKKNKKPQKELVELFLDVLKEGEDETD